MIKPKASNFTSRTEYLFACEQFKEAVKNGDKQAIMSDWNSRYHKKRKERKMADHIFCDGLRVEEKQISQDFKIIKLGIKAEPFMEFLAKYTNEKGYVNIDIKTSKGGKLYAELNTYGMSKTDEPEDDIVSFGEVEEIPY